MRTSNRTLYFPESVIREMNRIALEAGAVNLSQGYPDFGPPDAVLQAAKSAVDENWNQYSVTWGIKPLRDAIARRYGERYGMPVDPDRNVVVTCGATEAMMDALMATVDPGDEVIIFEPFYESYIPDSWMCGATPRFVPMRPAPQGEGTFTFDPDELAAAFNSRTKAIIVNSPHNPTGKLSAQELQFIADQCIAHDALAITDEIYEFITYDGHTHVPMATLPGMADRTITISSLSKTFSVTGWRLGFCVAAEDLMNAIRKAHDFTTVCAPTPLQMAGIAALGLGDDYYAQLNQDYRRRRDVLLGALCEVGFDPVVPQGAYYTMADFSAISDMDDESFARYLIKEVGVASVPGSSFYHHKSLGRSKVRFTFCKREETLHLAAQRLRNIPVGKLRR